MESFGYSGSGPRKNGIFISYRREDTAWPARCLYDRLKSGLNPVFMDVGSIQAGDNFPNEIRYNMSNCGILLALIGHDWMGTGSVKRTRRIDAPEDWVHIEIKMAIEGNIWAVPVLIDGATMPRASDLPDSLRPLTEVHAFTLSHNSFDREIGDLTAHVDAVRKGYRLLQGKWSLRLQESEGSDHIFRLSSDTRDYLIGISLTNRGKSAIAVGAQVEATAKSAADIAGKEIDLTALSSELGTRATIQVEILNPARSYRNKPETSYCFALRVGDRVFNYETEEYTQAQEKKRADQEQELAEQQRDLLVRQSRQQQPWSPQAVQNAEQARQALKYHYIGETIGIGLSAALRNEAVKEALKNALRRARR